MDTIEPFRGFTPATLKFFAQLKRNNNREWFTRHKEEYQSEVMRPAVSFVMEMGQALGRLTPGMVADPTAGGSIFRIYRDARFSADKSPYKTHMGIFFWQSPGKKLERPGFYVELDENGLRLYYGWYLFPPQALKAYRRAVADEDAGMELVGIVKKLRKAGITVGGEHYKRPPRGLEAITDERAALARHNTLYTEEDCGKAGELFSGKLVDYCVKKWKPCLPLHRWLNGNL